jgi:beta-aspartyl-dipeptidase (metallo-type)
MLHLLADIRLAGMISGKLGVLHIHSGNIPGAFDMYEEIVRRGFPIKHIRPTHCARVQHVYDSAVKFAKAGGYIDITTGGSCCFGTPAEGIMAALEQGVDPKLITMSSDGHGSKPRFNEKGEMVGLAVCGIECNLAAVQELVGKHKLNLPTALSFITSNVADSHLISDQGRIKAGACGNALLFNEDLMLTDVFAKGRAMMRSGEILVKGTFEL